MANRASSRGWDGNVVCMRGGVRQKSPGDVLFDLLATRCFQLPPPPSMHRVKSKRQIHHRNRCGISNAKIYTWNLHVQYVCLIAIRSTSIPHRAHILLPNKTQSQWRRVRRRTSQTNETKDEEEKEEEEQKAATWLIDGFAYCTWSMLITTTAMRTARLQRARAHTAQTESSFLYWLWYVGAHYWLALRHADTETPDSIVRVFISQCAQPKPDRKKGTTASSQWNR